eukprot:267042-Rhodomonas_salina.1
MYLILHGNTNVHPKIYSRERDTSPTSFSSLLVLLLPLSDISCIKMYSFDQMQDAGFQSSNLHPPLFQQQDDDRDLESEDADSVSVFPRRKAGEAKMGSERPPVMVSR